MSEVPLTAGNARVKAARKLARRAERAGRGLFLADGPKAVEGALAVPGCVVEVFATPAALAAHEHLLADLRAGTFVDERAHTPPTLRLVDDQAMAGLSDSVTPAGVVAVCRLVDVALADLVRDPAGDRGPARLWAICADVRDPGNAGTVVRTADAAGADAVVLAGHSVDAHNPKTVRASVGSLFHLPVAVERDPAAAVAAAHASGLTVLAADGAGEVDLETADGLLTRPTAWLFGNEAWGLPAELAALADHRVHIPIRGRAESLNLATAAAVCLFASARAHR